MECEILGRVTTPISKTRVRSSDAYATIVVSNICPIVLNVTPSVDLREREEGERGRERERARRVIERSKGKERIVNN